MKWEDMEAKPVCNMRRSLTRIVVNGGQTIVAFYVNSKQDAENCRLQKSKAEQTRNKADNSEHFKNWNAWSSKVIAELRKQKEAENGSGKRDRHE